jgi:hypothetical protein
MQAGLQLRPRERRESGEQDLLRSRSGCQCAGVGFRLPICRRVAPPAALSGRERDRRGSDFPAHTWSV